MHTLLQDLRFAVRTLRKGILVTLLAILSLSLAIGGNATVFSLINGFLYRPLPYHEADRIVLLGERETDQARGTNALVSSLAIYSDLQDRSQTLAELAAFRPATYSLSGGERPVPVIGARVTPSFFPLLGAAAQRGRVFRDDEGHEGAARVTVVTREYQERTWGAEVDPLEQVLVLNGEPHQVVGVLPAGWEFLTPGLDVWTPLRSNPRESPRDRRDAFILARMSAGVGMEAVYAEAEAIAGEIATEFPATNRGWTIDAFNLRHDIPTDQSRTLLALLQGSVLFVLLIACANITNLLLARGQERQREIALRTVLGAGRRRIVRQLLTESLLLVSVGGAAGLALGFLGIRLLTNAFAGQLPAAYAPVMDLNVLAFTLGVTVFAGLFFGLVPALQSFRQDQVGVLKEGGSRGASAGSRRKLLSKGLVVAEIALSMVALAGGSLLVQSFVELRNADPGFETENLLTAQLAIPPSKYDGGDQLAALLDRLKERTEALPAVRSATFTNSLPQNFLAPNDTFRVAGTPAEDGQAVPRAVSLRVGYDYLETLQVPLRQGRFLEDADRIDRPLVAVLNQTMAERRFPGQDPVGQQIAIRGETREIVGVVGDVRQVLIRQGDTSEETVYLPIAQDPQTSLFLVLRATGDPHEVTEPMRTAVGEVDPDITLSQVLTMHEFVDQFFVGLNVFNAVLAGFGVLALLLAALGTYGVLAYSVTQRTHEIGVRMAVGARSGQVVRMVARQGIIMAIIGLAVGGLLTVPLVSLIQSVLQGLGSVQPATVVLVAAVLFGVTVLASVLPARKAAGVDPVLALREE